MEVLEPYIGQFGRWQFYVYIMSGWTQLFGPMQLFIMTFYTPNLDFWCARPQSLGNISVDLWRNLSSPSGSTSQCEIYDIDYGNGSKVGLMGLNGSYSLRDCNEWEFDSGIYERTMLEEFSLVCSRNILISTCNSVSMAGLMVGIIFSGHLSDKIGRRKSLLFSTFMQTIFSAAMLFSNSFTLFMILRGFQSFFLLGMSTPSFVLFTEICSEKYRGIFGNIFYLGYALGMTIFAGIAYGLRNWYYIQILLTLPNVFIFATFWTFPESPRWLITHGRIKEAEEVIRKAARWNRIKLPEKEGLCMALQKIYDNELTHQSKETKKKFIDLLKSPDLRKKILNMFLAWFVIILIYYGLTFNTNNLGGDPFINFFLSSLLEFPGYILAAIIVHYVGRRLPMTVVMIIAGLACASPALIPQDMTTLLVTFTMIGKLFISCAYAIVYVYAAEIFPTVVRNIAVGYGSMIGNFGSVIAPYMKELAINTYSFVPDILFGVLSIVSGLLVLLLPETKGQAIPDTIEEAELLTRVGKQPKRIRKEELDLVEK